MNTQIDDKVFEEYRQHFRRYTRQTILRGKLTGAIFGGVEITLELRKKLSDMIAADDDEMIDLAETILKSLVDEHIKDYGDDPLFRSGNGQPGNLYDPELSGRGTKDDPLELIFIHELGRDGEYYKRSPKMYSG